VEWITVQLLESYPLQARLQVIGLFPNPCYQLVEDKMSIVRDGNEFHITLYQKKTNQNDDPCIQVIQPFDYSLSLDILGLPAGIYKVIVNGMETSFNLDIQNGWEV
jgi:inhibitor of cysteine peptidase